MLRVDTYTKDQAKYPIIDNIILKYQDRYLRRKVLHSQKIES